MKKWIKAFIPPVVIFYLSMGFNRGFNPCEWVFYDYQAPFLILFIFFLFVIGLIIKYLILDVFSD